MKKLLVGLLALGSISAFAASDIFVEPKTNAGDYYHAKSDKDKLCQILTESSDSVVLRYEVIKKTRKADGYYGDYISKLKKSGQVKRMGTNPVLVTFAGTVAPVISLIECQI